MATVITDAERYIQRFSAKMTNLLIHSWKCDGYVSTPCVKPDAPQVPKSKGKAVWFSLNVPDAKLKDAEKVTVLSPTAHTVVTIEAGVKYGGEQKSLEVWRLQLVPQKAHSSGFKADRMYTLLCDLIKGVASLVLALPTFRLSNDPSAEGVTPFFRIYESDAPFSEILGKTFEAQTVGTVVASRNSHLVLTVAFKKEEHLTIFRSDSLPAIEDHFATDSAGPAAGTTPPRRSKASKVEEEIVIPSLQPLSSVPDNDETDVTDGIDATTSTQAAPFVFDRTTASFDELMCHPPLPTPDIIPLDLTQSAHTHELTELQAGVEPLMPFVSGVGASDDYPQLTGEAAGYGMWQKLQHASDVIPRIFPGKTEEKLRMEQESLAERGEVVSIFFAQL